MTSVLYDIMMAKARAASLAFLKVFQCLEDGVDNQQILEDLPALLVSGVFSEVQDAWTNEKKGRPTRANALDLNSRCLCSLSVIARRRCPG